MVDDSMDVEVPIHEQLKALQRQLCQLKRRFGPAVADCVAAHNGFATTSGIPTSDHLEFQKARRLCNPMEVLGEGRAGGMNRMFMNRSAIKLANINAMLGFPLVSRNNQSQGHLHFVDLCGAPGGFSEYIVHQCRASGIRVCRGFGMSLLGANEHGNGARWKLSSARSEDNGFSLDYQVCKGSDGTGDIYQWHNVEDLNRQIHGAIGTNKVDLVLADGGFDAQRDFEEQEALTQKIVVCQAAAAMSLLQPNGTLVLKMFGFQTSVIRAVMRHLFMAFDQLTIVKPISSRPASAERYAVFVGFRGIPFGQAALSWRNTVLLEDYGVCWSEQDKREFQRLYKYLDEVDLKMVNLNLKNCFAILSALERKTLAVSNGQFDFDAEQHPRKHRVDIGAYKRQWRLQ